MSVMLAMLLKVPYIAIGISRIHLVGSHSVISGCDL